LHESGSSWRETFTVSTVAADWLELVYWSTLFSHLLPMLMNKWMHSAAVSQSITPVSYYSFPVPLGLGG